jgi:hypothetical protein
MNRESWLLAATEELEKLFFNKPPRVLPPIGVSCGIPKGSSKAIGQCWHPKMAKDNRTHLFICPSIDGEIVVLGTLLHELIHACVGIQEKHGGLFAKEAQRIGLAGKLTATYVEKDSKLELSLQEIVRKLGPYPHKSMNKSGSLIKKKKRKTKTNNVSLMSTTTDTYTISVSAVLLDLHGYPRDPWGVVMVEKP